MMISDEQVRRCVEYLQTPKTCDQPGCGPGSDIPPELLERVRSMLASVPELRDDRIAHARALLDGSGPTGAEVAEKMIGRIVSDSLR